MQTSIRADQILIDSRPKLKRITSHPFFGFILFGFLMVLVWPLQRAGLLNYSFAKALGQTTIYAIAALGFSFLMGYAGLPSLGTAGFAGLNPHILLHPMLLIVGSGLPISAFEICEHALKCVVHP